MTVNEKLNYQILAFTEDDIPEAMELKNGLGWNQTVADWKRPWWRISFPLPGSRCCIDRRKGSFCE